MALFGFLKKGLSTADVMKMKRKNNIKGLIKALQYKMDAKTIPEKVSGENVRTTAALALAELGDEQAVDPLLKNLENEYSSDGFTATAKALGKLGDPRAVKPLISSFQSSNEKKRHAAVEALAVIGKPALKPLLKTANSGNFWMRMHVAEALGKIGDPKALEPLLETLKSTTHEVFQAAAIALKQIKDVHAIEPLIEALRDPRRAGSKVPRDKRYSIGATLSENKDVCLRALETITGKDFGDDPDAWQQWWEKNKKKFLKKK